MGRPGAITLPAIQRLAHGALKEEAVTITRGSHHLALSVGPNWWTEIPYPDPSESHEPGPIEARSLDSSEPLLELQYGFF